MAQGQKTSIFQAKTITEARLWQEREIVAAGATLGFVPTMGNLHDGHGSLIAEAKKQCDKVAVSIFVNPMQFGPNEDFEKYPRTLERDIELCSKLGADMVFTPSTAELYGRGLENSSYVDVPNELTNKLCGAFRPGHFRGVATVVSKLFNIIQAHKAFFGEKDYQQLLVIRRMADDLNFPVQIKGLATIREADGLAMSSRNQYLNKEQRELAPILYQILNQLKEQVREQNKSIKSAIEMARAELSTISRDQLELQYLEACNPETLEIISEDAKNPDLHPEIVFLIAAKLKDVRLIDNLKV